MDLREIVVGRVIVDLRSRLEFLLLDCLVGVTNTLSSKNKNKKSAGRDVEIAFDDGEDSEQGRQVRRVLLLMVDSEVGRATGERVEAAISKRRESGKVESSVSTMSSVLGCALC